MQSILLHNFGDKIGLNLKKEVVLEEFIQIFLEACMKWQHNYFASREY